MKTIFFVSFFLVPQVLLAFDPPNLKLEYSYGLDMTCPLGVEPETLTDWQLALIPKIPQYRIELLNKMEWLQGQWDTQGIPLLKAASIVVGHPFQMNELRAALFLCPRFPSMGTPLSLNMISYLEASALDIPALSGKPSPILFFVSTAFHEVLHKYINDILENRPSKILGKLPKETELYKAHLHLFALHKKSFEDLNLSHLLPYIRAHEATHGPDYVRAWDSVYSNEVLFNGLLGELKMTQAN